MRLDRNGGEPKYALINLRKLRERGLSVNTKDTIVAAVIAHPDCIETSEPFAPNEFFAIKLKDRCAQVALLAYSNEAANFDAEYAADVRALALRSGHDHPLHKRPD